MLEVDKPVGGVTEIIVTETPDDVDVHPAGVVTVKL
jgi:hypothetical protein